jgi:hypothetical protein
LASGKQEKPGAKSTGRRPAIKTGEFKSAKTAPAVEAPKEGDIAEPVLSEAGDAAAAAAVAAPAAPAEAPAPVASVAKTASGKAKATTGARPAFKTSGGRKAVPDDAVAAPAARRAPSGAGTIWLVCRECSEEWTADIGRAKASDVIACPICDHRSQAPSDDVLRQIDLYKGIESRNLLMGGVAFGVGCLAMLAWTLLTTSAERAEDFTFFTLPLIVAGLSLLATFFFLSKHENGRWETYF